MSAELRPGFSGNVIGPGQRGSIVGFLQAVRRGVRAAIWIASILSVVCLGSSSADCNEGRGDSLVGSSLESVFSGVEMVRCVFSEERLVVQHRGQLKVLREGDRLPDAGLMVIDAGGDRIVVQTIETRLLSNGHVVPKAMVILSRSKDGVVETRVFRSEIPKEITGFAAPRGLFDSEPPFNNKGLETNTVSSKSQKKTKSPGN